MTTTHDMVMDQRYAETEAHRKSRKSAQDRIRDIKVRLSQVLDLRQSDEELLEDEPGVTIRHPHSHLLGHREVELNYMYRAIKKIINDD